MAALKDALSGDLERIQIIKGWIDAAGETQEQIYNVVWAGDRELNAEGKLPDVGNTVDIKNATWTNSIGAAELIGVWQDPDFDPSLKAFYYARVIEIPLRAGPRMSPNASASRCSWRCRWSPPSTPIPRRPGIRRRADKEWRRTRRASANNEIMRLKP